MRTAIITGSTAGIGLAIAEVLLRREHRVFISSRCPDKVSRTVDDLVARFPGRVAGAVCDVRDLDACEGMARQACRAFGRIDVLVNNAGISFIKPFHDVTSVMWRDVLDTNLTGTFNACKAVVPLLQAAGGGDIINLGSRSGRYAFAGGIGYNTTKFGLQGFTEALFLDLHQYGIRVSLVAPGTVATGLGGTEPKEWHLQPEDVGHVVVDVVESDPRACLNWIEIRPARPQ